MASLPSSTEILVIGAGPAGLAAALALQKNGCKDLVVIDALAAGENTSRAVAVHAATLEALEELGCADDLVKRGVIVSNGGNMWDGYRFHRTGDFAVLKPHTKYPYILFCPQHVTERVLEARCKEQGINVLRPVRVADLKVNADNPDYTDVIFDDGHVLKAHYIVGADGTKSLVRSIAGITYVDPDGEDPASEDVKAGIVADVVFATPPPTKPNEPLFVLTNGNFSLTLPLPPAEYGGEQAWRIASGIPIGTPPHAPPLDYLQGLIDAYGPGAIPLSAVENKTPLKIARVIWSTRFRTDSAVSSTPFARLGNGAGGVITLIGDAAHKHPPTGGQGLNLGVRDAVFLGPVLAEHSAEIARGGSRAEADKPLQAWADTRHERALTVIRLAKRGLRMLTLRDETVWYLGIIPVNWAKVRNFGFWLMGITGIMRRVQPWELSGLRNR